MKESVPKPWGYYVDLERNPFMVIKRIKVFPNQRFSLQYHKKRDEFWRVISGEGIVTLGDYTIPARCGQHFHIFSGVKHRMTAGPAGVMFLEIQEGECYENDIVRLEDDYGRV
mgnify:CR=1 FL=1